MATTCRTTQIVDLPNGCPHDGVANSEFTLRAGERASCKKGAMFSQAFQLSSKSLEFQSG